MGNTSSNSNVELKQTVINKTTIDVFNETLNSNITNNIITQAKSCSATISNINSASLDNFDVQGDFNIDNIEQTQDAAITFSCIQKEQMDTKIKNDMNVKIQDEILNKLTNDQKAELLNSASTESKAGFLSMPGNNTSTTVNSNTELETENIINQNIKTYTENVIVNNFNSDSVMKCIASIENNNSVKFSNIKVTGGVNIKTIKQSQVANLVSDCIQENAISNSVIDQIVHDSGVQIVNDTENIQDNKTIVTADTKAVATGPIEEVGNAVSSIIGSVTGSFIIYVILFCLLGAIGVYMFYKWRSGK